MKGAIFLIWLLVLSASSAHAQTLLSPSLSIANVRSGPSFSPSIIWNAEQTGRFNQFAYNNLNIDNVQVISVYEPNLRQDRVYFIDKYGNGDRWILSPSSPANTQGNFQIGQIDSWNPNGATDIVEALAFGALNSLFNGKATKGLFK